jgi:Transcriptional regulators
VDAVDKKILFMLLRDGRASQRSIATSLRLSPPAVNYRIRKLMEDKVIKKFTLYVNPNLVGDYHGFIAFKNYTDYDGEVVSFFKCLEWLNVYELSAKSMDELGEKFNKMSEKLGSPVMTYVPDQDLKPTSSFTKKILSLIKPDPLVKVSDVAKEMGVSAKTVNRHLGFLKDKGMIKVLPVLDVSKSDSVIFSMFTRDDSALDKFFSKYTFFKVAGNGHSIHFMFAENQEQAKGIVTKARAVDREADVMVIYDYDVSS